MFLSNNIIGYVNQDVFTYLIYIKKLYKCENSNTIFNIILQIYENINII